MNNTPNNMKAIGYLNASPITHQKALEDLSLPIPQPRNKDLLIKVKAISVNPVDVKIRANVSSSNNQFKIIGWDVSGIVVAKGESSSNFDVGDEVFYSGDLTRNGGNSEYHLVDERIVGYKPKSISHEESAALPLTSITAWEMLFDRFNIQETEKDESILIIGGAGGVASIAIQLLKARTNLTVIATASREESHQWVKSMGADHIINHNHPLKEQLDALQITPKYIFATNCSEQHLPDIVEIIKPQGHFGLIDDPYTLDIVPFKMKSITIHWEFMYTRSMFQTPDMIKQGELLNEIANLIDSQKIRSTMTKSLGVISAENLKKAHAIIEKNRTIGKITLSNFP